MTKFCSILTVMSLVTAVQASWYWPFGTEDRDKPRLSTLMSDATALIDDATELAAEGRIRDAVDKYREALTELANVEISNPDRAKTTEFASLRNKRAYVNAAIDSLLLAEARSNAKAVAITDTTDLERRFLERKGLVKPSVKPAPAVKKPAPAVKKTENAVRKSGLAERLELALEKEPGSRRLRLALIGEYIKLGRYDRSTVLIDELLKADQRDSAALNLLAVCQVYKGDMASAEKSLDLAIMSNPKDYNGYYNMANLKLQTTGDKDAARRYYETGRAIGGPADAELEAVLK